MYFFFFYYFFRIWVEWPQEYDEWSEETQKDLNDRGFGDEVENVRKMSTSS